MREYTFVEIGMLIGAAAGGVAAVVAFTFTNNAFYFIIAGIGVAVGILIGRKADRKYESNKNNR